MPGWSGSFGSGPPITSAGRFGAAEVGPCSARACRCRHVGPAWPGCGSWSRREPLDTMVTMPTRITLRRAHGLPGAVSDGRRRHRRSLRAHRLAVQHQVLGNGGLSAGTARPVAAAPAARALCGVPVWCGVARDLVLDGLVLDGLVLGLVLGHCRVTLGAGRRRAGPAAVAACGEVAAPTSRAPTDHGRAACRRRYARCRHAGEQYLPSARVGVNGSPHVTHSRPTLAAVRSTERRATWPRCSQRREHAGTLRRGRP